MFDAIKIFSLPKLDDLGEDEAEVKMGLELGGSAGSVELRCRLNILKPLDGETVKSFRGFILDRGGRPAEFFSGVWDAGKKVGSILLSSQDWLSAVHRVPIEFNPNRRRLF